MTEEKKNVESGLMHKLVEITQAVERIPKNGHNKHQNYDYALESDIKDVVRKEMANRNLMMIPNELSRTMTQIPTKNGSQQLVTLEIEFTVNDADSGEAFKMVGYGDGQDSGDKAVYKAKTGALKYTSRVHTYAMTAWRSPQVERLINILQKADFNQLLS